MTDVMADEIMIIDYSVFDRSDMTCCLVIELTCRQTLQMPR